MTPEAWIAKVEAAAGDRTKESWLVAMGLINSWGIKRPSARLLKGVELLVSTIDHLEEEVDCYRATPK